ncbi:MAG: PIN domain-containing protein [Actinomycetota bacterium]
MTTMSTFLADSSAWIDYLRNVQAPLRQFIDEGEIAHTEPVAMELLSGGRNDSEGDRVARMLSGTLLLQFDSVSDFPAATQLRRTAIRTGLRVGVVDCMILAVAGRYDVPLITKDRLQAELARSVCIRAELLPAR